MCGFAECGAEGEEGGNATFLRWLLIRAPSLLSSCSRMLSAQLWGTPGEGERRGERGEDFGQDKNPPEDEIKRCGVCSEYLVVHM